MTKTTLRGKIWQDMELNLGPLDPKPYTLPTELSVLDRMNCLVHHLDYVMQKILWTKIAVEAWLLGNGTQDTWIHSLILYH